TYSSILLGVTILTYGLFNVHSQSQITEGGVLGLTLFLEHWTGVSPSVSGITIDILCYILAFRYFGKQFLKYAIVASIGFSTSYAIHERIGYTIPNMADNPILAAIIGAIFVGVGVSLVVRVGGASGGDDALALVISKTTKIQISKAYFVTDFVVLMMSLSYIPIGKILCSLITVSLSSYIIGVILSFEGKEVVTDKFSESTTG
ncbi:MAG: YitT family protein, partial [Clostridium sp.]